jgi:hypothetical protein
MTRIFFFLFSFLEKDCSPGFQYKVYFLTGCLYPPDFLQLFLNSYIFTAHLKSRIETPGFGF